MMTESMCQHVDAYLDATLEARVRTAFEEHLSTCDTCREALRIQRCLDDLVSDARDSLEQVPDELDRQVRRILLARTNRHVRRRTLVAASVAAAIALAWLARWEAVQRRREATAPAMIVSFNEEATEARAELAMALTRAPVRRAQMDFAWLQVPTALKTRRVTVDLAPIRMASAADGVKQTVDPNAQVSVRRGPPPFVGHGVDGVRNFAERQLERIDVGESSGCRRVTDANL